MVIIFIYSICVFIGLTLNQNVQAKFAGEYRENSLVPSINEWNSMINGSIAFNSSPNSYVKEISVYIYQNERITLPKSVQARFSNGKVENVNVYWETNSLDTSKIGVFTIDGSTPGYRSKVKFTANIEPMDNIISKLVVLPEEQYDEIEVKKILDRISRIYPRVLDNLLSRGVKIKLITSNITELPEYEYLKGKIPRGWEGTGKTWDDVPGVSGNPVAIKIGFSERGKGHGSINLELHETAHTIDGYILNMISKTKTFEDVWKSDVNSLFPQNSYFMQYPDEYFAETFAMFYLDNSSKYELSLKAPKTFKFFEDLEESFYIKL